MTNQRGDLRTPDDLAQVRDSRSSVIDEVVPLIRRRPLRTLAVTSGGLGRTVGIGLARTIATSRLTGISVALVLLWLAFWTLDPVFLSSQNLLNILLQSSNVAIVAAGLTVVLIAGEFDLSIGSIEGLAGSVSAIAIIVHGAPVPVGIAAGLGVGAIVGLVNGLIVWRLRIPSFIATLAMLGIAHGIALILTNARGVSGFPSEFRVIGTAKVGAVPVPVLLAIGVFAALYILLNHSRVGLRIYAVGSNIHAARRAGLGPGRVKTFAFVISGVTAAIGGLILSARLNAGNGTFGQSDLLLAVAAVVIGGTSLTGGVGTIVGTALGVVLITSVKNGLVILDVAAFWQEIAVGALILGAVMVDRLTKTQNFVGPQEAT